MAVRDDRYRRICVAARRGGEGRLTGGLRITRSPALIPLSTSIRVLKSRFTPTFRFAVVNNRHDMVDAQAIEADRDRIHDIAARRAAIIRPGSHIALDANRFQGTVQYLFGFTARIAIGGIEEIDARRQGAFDKRIGPGLIDTGDRF